MAQSGKRRLTAHVSAHLQRRGRQGRPAIFAYGYGDLADFLGFRNIGSVRNAVSKGLFDPANLESIFAFKARARKRKET